MAVIIPAILPKTFGELREKAEIAAQAVSTIQLDICDGIFVPNKTWPYTNGTDAEGDKNFADILSEMQGLPSSDYLDYEIDLMTANPLQDAKTWISAGAARIIVHVESTPEPLEVIRRLYEEFSMPDSVASVEIGAAIGHDTSLAVLDPLIPYLSVLQVMGIRRIGFQHQPFDPAAPGRVAELRQKYPELIISVDGGVSDDTERKLLQAGADRLIVGSAIFDSGNPLASIEHFESLA